MSIHRYDIFSVKSLVIAKGWQGLSKVNLCFLKVSDGGAWVG